MSRNSVSYVAENIIAPCLEQGFQLSGHFFTVGKKRGFPVAFIGLEPGATKIPDPVQFPIKVFYFTDDPIKGILPP